MKLSAVICAAGAGTRMGQTKALCQLTSHETFLSAIVHTLRTCQVHDIVAVIGSDAQNVIQHHDTLGIQWAINHNWQSTYMLESLQCGLNLVAPDATIIHWPVDCQFIHPDDLKSLILAPDSPLAVLSWNQIPGHPMRISPHAAEILRNPAAPFESLRVFVASQKCISIEAQHEALINCNDPETLHRFHHSNQ